nr:EAL domain-containing protein [Aestuariivirga litoralis]
MPQLEESVAARSGETTALAERINFALEPVVDMRTRHTAHYRLHMSLPLGKVEVSGEALLEQVSRSGLRPQLDSVAVNEVLLLLQRLRQRDGDLCIIMPIGAQTLADPQTVKRIAEATHAAGSAGQGLVLELRHAMLPLLTPPGLEGLAQLSRQGQSFALADAAPGALDLAAMKTLHVKMVGIEASELMQAQNQPSLTRFAQEARLHGISTVIIGVEDPQLVSRLTQVTPLACGPCFAAPRRVKRAHGETQDKHQKLVQAA